ncbi:MAG: ABC transporter permease [Sedimentisphaerales bacterium]|nr:ABC transporter permease [Sedimentisphaerales bacterium]
MSNLINDIKYAFRQLRRNPGFTVVAVLTLGLGIGATTTVFSVFKAWIFNPFPYPDADRIVHVWSNISKNGEGPLSEADFLDIKERNQSFSNVAAYTLESVDLGGDKPESVHAVRTTTGLLRIFGLRPVLGRFFDKTDEDDFESTPVAIISYGLWKRLFACDQDVIGKTIHLNKQETTIIGVMPANFEFYTSRQEGRNYEIWRPRTLRSKNRGNQWLLCMARLKEEVSFEEAEAEIKTIGSQLAAEYPGTNRSKPFCLRSHHEEITRKTRSSMWFLLATVGLLLLIACANVASMLLAKGTGRQAEFSLRFAIGAQRSDMMRLLFTESFLLALLGSAAGIVFAVFGLTFIRSFIPPETVLESQKLGLHIDGMVLMFSVGLSVLTAFLFGLLPAFTVVKSSIAEMIKQGGRSQAGSRIRYRFLRYLVVGQIALLLAVANCSILLSRSYLNVINANSTLVSERVLTSNIILRGERYNSTKAREQFWNRLIERIGAIPGVSYTAAGTNIPLEGSFSCPIIQNEKTVDPSMYRSLPLAEISYISPDYFVSMGIPFLQGRSPKNMDNEGEFIGVAVNRALVKALWPEQNPIGKMFKPPFPDPFFKAKVVGVVEDVRQWGPEVPALPQVYFPLQSGGMNRGTLVIRTTAKSNAFAPLLRQELANIDPDLLLVDIHTMKQALESSTSGRRFYTIATNAFMGLALVITVVGIYGTLSYNLMQRKREIGVRMALGALRGHILGFVVRQAGQLLVVGLIIGLTLTAILSFILRSLLYDISPLNPMSLLLGLGIICGTTCLASLIPAIHATRVDPMEALRYE